MSTVAFSFCNCFCDLMLRYVCGFGGGGLRDGLAGHRGISRLRTHVNAGVPEEADYSRFTKECGIQ